MEKQTNIFLKIIDAFQDLADWLDQRGGLKAMKALFFLTLTAGLCLGVFYGYRVVTQLDIGVHILKTAHDTPEQLQTGLEADVKANLLIEKEATRCLYEHGADSFIFAKFHNSVKDLSGKHDFYYSASNEVVRKGGLEFSSGIQNIPVTRLGQYMVPFIDKKCQTVTVREMAGNEWLRHRLELQGIHTLISCPVYNLDSFLIGFTELVYSNNNERIVEGVLDFSDKDMQCFIETTNKVSIIISN